MVVTKNSWKPFSTPKCIIAGGVVSCEPRKCSPKECEKFENKSLFYSIKDKKIFNGKTVTIFGGGDSALDWAVELSKSSQINLVHRREKFRGAPATLNTVKERESDGTIHLSKKSQLEKVNRSKKRKRTEVKNDNEDTTKKKTS